MFPISLPDNVYRQICALMSQYAEHLGVPPDRCDDMVQDAWVHALRSETLFSGDRAMEEFRRWFIVIVHNLAVDAIRGIARHSVVNLEALVEELVDEKQSNPSEVVEREDCLSFYLERLLRQEPKNYRLLCAHLLEGRTNGELAEATGLTSHEISCRIWRAIHKMQSWAAE